MSDTPLHYFEFFSRTYDNDIGTRCCGFALSQNHRPNPGRPTFRTIMNQLPPNSLRVLQCFCETVTQTNLPNSDDLIRLVNAHSLRIISILQDFATERRAFLAAPSVSEEDIELQVSLQEAALTTVGMLVYSGLLEAREFCSTIVDSERYMAVLNRFPEPQAGGPENIPIVAQQVSALTNVLESEN